MIKRVKGEFGKVTNCKNKKFAINEKLDIICGMNKGGREILPRLKQASKN